MTDSGSHELSRRSAFAGLGLASMGLFLGSHAAAVQTLPNRDTGTVAGGDDLERAASQRAAAALVGHRLTGRWLSMIGLPSNPDITIAAPSFFGADGTAVIFFPGTEAARRGVHVKGPAMGTWEAVDDHKGHITAVQVLSDFEGSYVGTVTLDAVFSIEDDGESYSLDGPLEIFTIRDHHNQVMEQLAAPAHNPMRGFRMAAGNPGFPTAVQQPERRTPD